MFPKADILMSTWDVNYTDLPIIKYESPIVNYHPFGNIDPNNACSASKFEGCLFSTLL